ncbi:MAG: heme-binding protein [Betaproteobacteria bacterium]|nr:heme-binding protein [Betaproteobacteria bacterium]
MSLLTLKQADIIIDQALAKARQMKLPPLAVVVLDDSGYIKAVKREDGASMFRVEIGQGKAWGAVAMGCSSRALANRAKQNPNFFLTLAATSSGKFLPQQGGVLIRDAAGAILGAVGISGASGDEDEACGAHGVEQAGLKPDVSG